MAKIAYFATPHDVSISRGIVNVLRDNLGHAVTVIKKKEVLLYTLSDYDLVIFFGDGRDFIDWIEVNIEKFSQILYICTFRPVFENGKFHVIENTFDMDQLKKKLKSILS